MPGSSAACGSSSSSARSGVTAWYAQMSGKEKAGFWACLGGWILDPQSIKPGNHMATVPVKSEDLQPLIEYLESLK